MTRSKLPGGTDLPVERGFAFVTDPAYWSRFWPGFIRLEEASRWAAPGDTATLITRLLGRERALTMTLTAFEPNRLVTYDSVQPGLPDTSHERHFESEGDGFVYRLGDSRAEPRWAGRGHAVRSRSGASRHVAKPGARVGPLGRWRALVTRLLQ